MPDFAIISAGLLRGAYYVPISLAFALVARHGRYLPLWLPECGMIAAYTAYFLTENANVSTLKAVVLGLALGAAAAVVTHYGLFAHHVAHSESYAALLRGIAIVVLLENVIGLRTGGYALVYKSFAPVGLQPVDSVKVDIAVVVSAIVLSSLTWAVVNHTRVGLVYRAVSSNRELAAQYGMAILKVDTAVLAVGGVLCSYGGIADGLRYGLTPNMMSSDALKALAVVVAVGPDRLMGVAAGMLGVGILESICQGNTHLSPFESGVSYVVLIAGIAIHHILWPHWQRLSARRDSRKKQLVTEAQP